MFWGCFGYNGVGPLQPIDGMMRSEQYITILGKKKYESKPEISVETRAVIIALHAEGYSSRQIAFKTNVSQTIVVRTLQRKKETGQNKSSQRSGRPRITSKGEDKFIRLQIKRQRTRTAPEINEELNATRQKIVSVSTVQRRLRDYGLKGCVAATKPL
nr:uncharacterized protein LOC122271000 [Parasteatoda tepidariorum]